MTDVLTLDSLPSYLQDAIARDSRRTLCPKCGGGQTQELSLSIIPKLAGVLRLSCWRASCDWYALTMTDPDARLLDQLEDKYPDWYVYHNKPIEAAIEIGLLDEDDLAIFEIKPLNFHNDRHIVFDTPETDYD